MPFQNKFTSLSLAFKTDKLTLTNRLELQQRQRDIAEKNIDVEIAQLKKEVEVGGPFSLYICRFGVGYVVSTFSKIAWLRMCLPMANLASSLASKFVDCCLKRTLISRLLN